MPYRTIYNVKILIHQEYVSILVYSENIEEEAKIDWAIEKETNPQFIGKSSNSTYRNYENKQEYQQGRSKQPQHPPRIDIYRRVHLITTEYILFSYLWNIYKAKLNLGYKTHLS